MRTIASTVLLSAAALLLAAAPAHAASAYTVTECPEFSRCVEGAYYDGGAEANRLTVVLDGRAVRFTDPAAEIAPGRGCRHVAPDTVECTAERTFVRTGEGENRVVVDDRGYGGGEAMPVHVDGGYGSDVLVGGELPETLRGGPGDDEIQGRGGGDVIWSGGGADVVDAGEGDDGVLVQDTIEDQYGTLLLPPEPDRVDGGPGGDSVAYGGDDRHVEVDLATGAAGGAAAGDALAGVENLTGGFGPASFAGDDGPNRLVAGTTDSRLAGREGDDDLVGRGGRDVLDGGPGGDHPRGNVVLGGPGDDRIRSATGGYVHAGDGDDRVALYGLPAAPLRIVCGAGEDVAGGMLRTSAAPDCEWLEVGADGAQVRSPLRLESRLSATTMLRAPAGTQGRFVVRDRRTGRRLFAFLWVGRGPIETTLIVPPPRATARRVRREGSIAVTVEERGEAGRRAVTRLVAG
jgi:hypothetical protein